MRKLLISVATLALAAAGCTVHQTDVPSIGGPSTNAITLRVTATPDTLPQNGTAQATIAITAFNAGGQPFPNLTVRLDMQVSGATQDLGTLTPRTLVTKADGTATAVYTVPAGPGPGGLGTTVAVVATPIAGDAANAGILNTVGAVSQVYVHLTPAGEAVPPRAETPTALFSVTPAAPTAGAIVLFNGSTSCPSGATGTANTCVSANSTIVGYDWDFGDNTAHGSGQTATHVYSVSRPYPVTLRVTNSQGNSASTTSIVTVAAGTGPTALFTILPNPVAVNGTVTLDGSPSTGGIVNYRWQIVTPNPPNTTTQVGGPSPTTTLVPTIAGTWTITLFVTDAQGRVANTSLNLIVNP